MVHSVKTLAPHTCSHGHSSHMASLSVLWSWSLAVYLWWRRTMRSWWEKKWRIIEIKQAVPDLFPGSRYRHGALELSQRWRSCWGWNGWPGFCWLLTA